MGKTLVKEKECMSCTKEKSIIYVSPSSRYNKKSVNLLKSAHSIWCTNFSKWMVGSIFVNKLLDSHIYEFDNHWLLSEQVYMFHHVTFNVFFLARDVASLKFACNNLFHNENLQYSLYKYSISDLSLSIEISTLLLQN